MHGQAKICAESLECWLCHSQLTVICCHWFFITGVVLYCSFKIKCILRTVSSLIFSFSPAIIHLDSRLSPHDCYPQISNVLCHSTYLLPFKLQPAALLLCHKYFFTSSPSVNLRRLFLFHHGNMQRTPSIQQLRFLETSHNSKATIIFQSI